jgi:hypothetical protein
VKSEIGLEHSKLHPTLFGVEKKNENTTNLSVPEQRSWNQVFKKNCRIRQ